MSRIGEFSSANITRHQWDAYVSFFNQNYKRGSDYPPGDTAEQKAFQEQFKRDEKGRINSDDTYNEVNNMILRMFRDCMAKVGLVLAVEQVCIPYFCFPSLNTYTYKSPTISSIE